MRVATCTFWTLALVTLLCAALPVAATARPDAGAARGAPAAKETVSLAVSFAVRNTNTSGVPCPSDGARYTVRGRLIGPRSALEGDARVAGLYVHGFVVGGFGWELSEVPGYDYGAELAKLGHVTVSIDLPGWDRSDKPNGLLTCLGSDADVTHQIVTRLRNGNYGVEGGAPVVFERVVLAGHDIGGPIAEIEAYSYRDVDALMVMSWAEQGFTSTVLGWVVVRPVPGCALGGVPAPGGGPGGYERYPPSLEEGIVAFHDAEPAIVQAIYARAQPVAPCGIFTSITPAVAINNAGLAAIRVPVFILQANYDFPITREGGAVQPRHFRNSDDVTLEQVETGHFPWLERRAPQVRATIAEWMRARGFVSAAARTDAQCPARNPTIAGGSGRDRLSGGPGPDNLVGLGGKDLLVGGGGEDCLVGGAGADRIDARDGRRDEINCGPGSDRVRADRIDLVRGCELVRRRRHP